MKIDMSGQDSIRHDAIDCLEIIHRLKEGIAVLRNGRFTFANPAFEGITGRRLDELMGKELPEPFPAPLPHRWRPRACRWRRRPRSARRR